MAIGTRVVDASQSVEPLEAEILHHHRREMVMATEDHLMVTTKGSSETTATLQHADIAMLLYCTTTASLPSLPGDSGRQETQ